MKKLLSLLMLLCMVCTGAWADAPTFDNSKVYTIKNLYDGRGTMVCYQNSGYKLGLTDITLANCTGNSVNSNKNPNSKWGIYTYNGYSYIYSAASTPNNRENASNCKVCNCVMNNLFHSIVIPS